MRLWILSIEQQLEVSFVIFHLLPFAQSDILILDQQGKVCTAVGPLSTFFELHSIAPHPNMLFVMHFG